MITVTHDILKKLSLVGKELDEYSLDTVKMFHEDALKAGYLGNNILPARAGELVRAAYLARKNNISASYALAVGLVERLMDLIALIVLGSFALSSIGVVSPVFQNALKGVSVLGLIG